MKSKTNQPNINTIHGTEQLKRHITICTIANVPTLILGAPGIGKTETISQVFADESKYYVESFTGSEKNPTDLSGILVPDLKTKKSVYLIPELASNLNNTIKEKLQPVLVIDELPTAEPAVAANMLELINHCKAGPHSIPDSTTRIALGNAPEHAPDIFHLSPVMGNRMSIVNYTGPSLSEYLEHANPHPAITGLLRTTPDLLLDYDPTNFSNPTPRSWSLLSKMLTAIETLDSTNDNALNTPLAITQCASLVGDHAAAEMQSYLIWFSKLPKISDIIREPKATPIPSELPAQYMLASLLAKRLPVDKPKIMTQAYAFMSRMPTEVALITVKALVKRDPAQLNHPSAEQYINALADIL